MKTIKVKTSELTGAALDWAVAEAEGLMPSKNWTGMYYRPSTDWGVTGLLIEKYKITLYWHPIYHYEDGDSQPCWEAQPHDVLLVAPDEYDPVGDTALIAACRAIVASKLGDTVEVPEQLVEVKS